MIQKLQNEASRALPPTEICCTTSYSASQAEAHFRGIKSWLWYHPSLSVSSNTSQTYLFMYIFFTFKKEINPYNSSCVVVNPYFASCGFCLYHWRVTNLIDLKYLKDSVEMMIWNLYWKEVVPMFAPMDGSRHISLNPMETECGPPVSIWNVLKSLAWTGSENLSYM